MKQLLAWCAERTQKAQGSGSKGRDPDLVKAFTAVQDNVIEGIRSGKIDCSWYKRKKDVRDERTVVTKPNPKNIENQQMLAKLDQTLHRWECHVLSSKGII